ncbi:hypothetical protein RvY_17704 [Ramazzottius varieornatus]|uniref:Ras-GEF domain-containing protein n=1 Tax=Ramazzottius varieornatus TaxID=947166 RepID=A0A1D1W6U7_RAMVA|nr:hypothetical protein RvY_17704 [Ramazzottius varieornatus]
MRPTHSPSNGHFSLKRACNRWSATDAIYDTPYHERQNSHGSKASLRTSNSALNGHQRRQSLDRAVLSNDASINERKELEDISYLEKEVYFALRYLQDVVEKHTTELLAGSATVVIENIFVLDSRIHNTQTYQEQKSNAAFQNEFKEMYRCLASVVNWADQILLRRGEIKSVLLRRNNHIVPQIQVLRQHVRRLVEHFRNAQLKSSPAYSQLPLRRLPMSISAESLNSASPHTSMRLVPQMDSIGYDQVDHAAVSFGRMPSSRASFSSLKNSSLPPSPKSSLKLPSTPVLRQSGHLSCPHGDPEGSIQSLTTSMQSRSPSPQLSRNVSLEDSGFYSPTVSTSSLPPRPTHHRKTLMSSLVGQGEKPGATDITAVVSALFANNKSASPRHRFLRQMTDEPIYYDNISEKASPPLPPKTRNVISYVETFGRNTNAQSINSFKSSNQSIVRDITNPTNQSTDKYLRSSIQSPSIHQSTVRNGGEAFPPFATLEELFDYDCTSEDPFKPTTKDPPRVWLSPKSDKYILANLDCTDLLVHNRPASDGKGPTIKGGVVDALIVEATRASKKDFAYQEAFVATYRTFIPSSELIEKLLFRHGHFSHASCDQREQSAARDTFTLLIRVVEELCLTEIFETSLIDSLLKFVQQLFTAGELTAARSLRKKILDKHDVLQKQRGSSVLLLQPNTPRRGRRLAYLLDFKSQDLAEQMTLLDADLLSRIESTELLGWTKEQSEFAGPNLTRFTEHFNKVSFWARTRLLEQTDQRDREKYFIKIMKIMKHLRRLQNFNSYLALLAAIDSAPVRRLNHSKTLNNEVKLLGELIDSSQSFRAYRAALANIQPPCIPYIGIALQDLTFVNESNDWLDTGKTVVNFSKRWQQYNVLNGLSRFLKTCQYNLQRNESIVQFFNNFDSFLSEEALWQISEAIRPRTSHK